MSNVGKGAHGSHDACSLHPGQRGLGQPVTRSPPRLPKGWEGQQALLCHQACVTKPIGWAVVPEYAHEVSVLSWGHCPTDLSRIQALPGLDRGPHAPSLPFHGEES